MKFSVLAPLLIQAASVSAWGKLGHATVALLAQQYLTPRTVENVQILLDDRSTTYMGNIAVWADSYRSQPGGEFSAVLHFVNGDDAPPPESCHLDLPSDCPPEGCVVSAIGNYVRLSSFLAAPVIASCSNPLLTLHQTERLKSRRLPFQERQQALKFLVHVSPLYPIPCDTH